jgi:hypothetical protein
MVLARLHARSTTKIDSKNSLYHHRYFTKHLLGAFGKSQRESDLNHESSSLLIRWLKSTTRIQPATIHTEKRNKNRRFLNIQGELPGHELPWFERQELNPTGIGWSARNPNSLNTQCEIE